MRHPILSQPKRIFVYIMAWLFLAMIQFVFAMRNRKALTHLLQQASIPLWMLAGTEDLAVPIEDSLEQK